MDIFVNREQELRIIEEALADLTEQKRLLRQPIIEVQGISGIGKTSLLRQIELRCREIQLRCISVDVSQRPSEVSRQIIAQVKSYLQDTTPQSDPSPVFEMQRLLERGPVVLLLDAIDSAYDDELSMIESYLQDLIDDERLFVVLTSKKEILFKQKRSLARKLKILPLKLLSRTYCDLYIDQSSDAMQPAVRQQIFEWTRGYPLAMSVAVEAVKQGFDPLTEEGKKEILMRLSEQVVDQEILAAVEVGERKRYGSLLRLLAVPRRFNLIILQELIETFYQERKQENSIGYFSLPYEINDATGVLNWNIARAGFSIDEPVRALFLHLLKAEQPERYFAIHAFMAQVNLELAQTLTGSDCARAVRECLYHLACNTNVPLQTERLVELMQIVAREKAGIFYQFAEDFQQDTEMHDVLGVHLAIVQGMIDTHLQELQQEKTLEG